MQRIGTSCAAVLLASLLASAARAQPAEATPRGALASPDAVSFYVAALQVVGALDRALLERELNRLAPRLARCAVMGAGQQRVIRLRVSTSGVTVSLAERMQVAACLDRELAQLPSMPAEGDRVAYVTLGARLPSGSANVVARRPLALALDPERPPRPSGNRRGGARWGLIGAGLGALLGGYVLNLVGGLFAGYHVNICFASPCGGSGFASSWSDVRTFSGIPLIGPWMQLAAKPTSFTQDGWGAWLVADGLVQAAGLAMLIASGSLDGPDASDVAVVPDVSRDRVGLRVVGAF